MHKTNLHGLTVQYRDQQEFHSLKNEIFTQHAYYFESDNPTPYIIDAGAHIGLATLYFKKQFPGARVLAIEPHPQNLQLLEDNIFLNDLTNVTVVEGALSPTAEYPEEMILYAESENDWLSTTSLHPGAWTGDQTTSALSVTGYPLADFLTEPVDLLKLDIEGAEQAILESVPDRLHLIKRMFVEFHPHPTQSLEKITKLLTDHHFKLTFSKNGKPIPQDQARGLVMLEAVQ